MKQALTYTDCVSANYDFNRPFELALERDQVVSATEVVRVLPKKRMVAFGTWQGMPVVIKLFFDHKHALRHRDADVAGMKALYTNNIPAPALRYEGRANEKRIHVLIYERIQQAESLYALWRQTPDVHLLEATLKNVVIELATQHVLGVVQKDVHLGNFLITDKQVITLDGGQIEASYELTPKEKSMDNLALFFSQLGAGVDDLCELLFKHYAKARGWLLKKEDSTDLQLSIKKYNEQRFLQFDKKLMRSSSMQMKYKTWAWQGMLLRQYQTPEFLAFLKEPDLVFSKSDAVILKNGRSSTVIQITLDNRVLVIKRYNLKHLWHRLRRSLRLTRAATSWRLAHKLRLFHVATATPVAYLERAVVGLRGRSYLVMEAVPGVNLGSYCQGKTALDESVRVIAPRVVALLNGLKAVGVTHGDLKSTNILVGPENYPVFIDLDGAKEHATQTGLRQAWRFEVKRFLKNFDAQPTIKALFKAMLT